MTDDISAMAGSKNRGRATARRHVSEALRPTDAEGLARLWDYVKQHGTSQPPHEHKAADGFLLGRWVGKRRKDRGAHPELDRLLESLPGWTWSAQERGFEERLSRYKELAEAGNLNRHRPLRMWALAHRRLGRAGKVSDERLEQLRTAGII